MPGMTMPFKVKDAALLAGPGAGRPHPGDARRRGRARLPEGDRTDGTRAGHRASAAHPPVAMLEPGDEVPDVALIDESGATRRLSEWRGRTLAITFIYTRCPLPDFCPLMDRQFADVQQIVDRRREPARARPPAVDQLRSVVRHARRPGRAHPEGRRGAGDLELSDRRRRPTSRRSPATSACRSCVRGPIPETSCITSGPRSSTPMAAW